VTWDGQDTADVDRAALREHAAVIFQDYLHYCLPARDNIAHAAVIFQDYLHYCLPARDNIALGRHERFHDRDAIRAACDRAGIAEMLARLPDGMDTMLGAQFHGGVDISVGQWQRVALARVFFRDASFVVLDEPAAALDAKAEHELSRGSTSCSPAARCS
jgi:ABC-type multidrug transport system fused ATPase/permease subunit